MPKLNRKLTAIIVGGMLLAGLILVLNSARLPGSASATREAIPPTADNTGSTPKPLASQTRLLNGTSTPNASTSTPGSSAPAAASPTSPSNTQPPLALDASPGVSQAHRSATLTPSAVSATPIPFPTLPPGTPILSPGGARAATGLAAETECSQTVPSRGNAKLIWTTAVNRGAEQRVIVTIYSFEDGPFETTEPLPPDQTSLVWTRVHGQAIHFWKVLTLQADGWAPSETAEFEGPACISN